MPIVKRVKPGNQSPLLSEPKKLGTSESRREPWSGFSHLALSNHPLNFIIKNNCIVRFTVSVGLGK
jgi:hypothetical protein